MTLSSKAVERFRESLTSTPVPPRYTLRNVVGEGGMGVVWRARDTVLDRDVAVKILAPHLDDDEFAARLAREAKLIAALEHPGIVPVFDLRTGDSGASWYAMRFVEGVRLDVAARDGRSLRDVLRIIETICETVAYAHAHHVVHRDLKPGNVMLGPFGEVLVLDWGVAIDPRSGSGTGAIMGTPEFMAPEQAAGLDVDARADIHAIGVMIRDLAGSAGHLISKPLASIIAKACAPDARERYETALALRDDLRRFAAGELVLAHRESAWERVQRFLTTYQTAVILVLAYLIMRLVVLLWRGI